MYLHLPPLSPFHSPSKKPPSPPNPNALSLLFRNFESSLLSHLNSLLPPPPSDAGAPPAVSFAYLSRTADALSSFHAAAGALISDPSLSRYDEAALSSYLKSSLKLLDVCNAVSKEIERLHLGRLLLLFAAHLLSAGGAPPPEKIRKARESIREWEGSSPGTGRIGAAAAGLIGDLEPRGPPPNGKVTALGRAIYAVEAVSALVAGALVSSLGGELDLAAGRKAPLEFVWAESFNELRAALVGGTCAPPPGEVKAVEASVRKVAEIMDGPSDDGEMTEGLGSAVKGLENATDDLTEGLDRFRGAVNGLFRAVVCTRNTALQSYRPVPNRCK